jgi:hypothetical protein
MSRPKNYLPLTKHPSTIYRKPVSSFPCLLRQKSILNVNRKPIFGLIFLFEYHPGLDEEGEDEEIGDLWFANQVRVFANRCSCTHVLPQRSYPY